MDRKRSWPPLLNSETENSGVYIIRNLLNDKVYVGQAVNCKARWKIHRHHLRTGKHPSPHLQHSWDKNGEECFEFRVVEPVHNKNKLNEREQFWMAKYQCTDRYFGYNVTPTAGSQRGYHHSVKSRKKMSKAGKGRKLSPEWRTNISKAMLGVEHNETARRKLSEAHARLSNAQIFTLLDAYADGVAQRDLADQYGMSLSSVNKIIRHKSYRRRVDEWLRERGMDALPFHPRPLTTLTKHEIFEVYDCKRRGELQRDTARRFGVSDSLVSQLNSGHKCPEIRKEWMELNAITDEDIKKMTMRPSKLSENDIYNILDLIEEEVKQRTIAKRFGISPPTICDIVKGRTHREVTMDWRSRRNRRDG